MSDDFERRLRRSLDERSADPLPGESALPRSTRRRARMQRYTNAVSALLVASLAVIGTTTLIRSGRSDGSSPVLPAVSPTRVPEPDASVPPSVAAVAKTTPPKSSLARVAVVPDAGAKVFAHGGVWVAATTRLLKYTTAGKLAARIATVDLLGPDVVLEPRVIAADDAGIWVAGAGAERLDRTFGSGDCSAVEPAGGDRDGEAFVVRIDAATLCPSVFIKLGVVASASADPGLLPTATSSPSPASSSASRSRFVRWHGLAFAAGSLWIGADGGMLRADLARGTLNEVDVDAYSVGAGFGSVWAAVSQHRGTPQEDDFIARIDPETGAVIERIDVPPADPSTTTDFAEVHVGPDAVWAEGWGIVSQIDPATNQIVARYNVGGEHLQGDMTSGAGRFYLADNGPDAEGVWVIDAARRRALRTITTDTAAAGIALAGNRLWFSMSDGIYRMRVR